MTVGELRKALEIFPDDMTVLKNGEYVEEIGLFFGVKIYKVRKYEDEESRIGYGEYDSKTGKDCVVL